ncbi:hypothetical protein BG015_006626 [Linnemannia schmuckeri]|uniref:Uncharacterized protein n=1 Tax=Linnemannia schmuckeri TaxID=64567 RepID=A0A9P5VFB4_9FUNG|nr:hypothetical protein BG015_006626 [Linnemannia schmuckeri]
MVYKGKNFDPHYHLKKNFDRSLRESNYNSYNYHYNSNGYNNNYNNDSGNHSLPPPPHARQSDRSPPDRASSIDNDRSRNARSSSRPRLEDSVDRRPERSLSRNYDDVPLPSRQYDKAHTSRHHDHNKRDSDRYTPSSSPSSSSSNKRDRERQEDDGSEKEAAGSNYNTSYTTNSNNSSNSSGNDSVKVHESPLEKKSRMEDHLERNPHDKQAHADAYSIYGVNIRKAPEDRERTGTPALTPRDNYMDGTGKDGELQQQQQQQQQSLSLSALSAIPHEDLQEYRNTTENDHHFRNNINHINNYYFDPDLRIRQSSAASTSSISTTTSTNNQNPWTRSPSMISFSSRLQSPPSNMTEIHPEPSSHSTLAQPYNQTEQDKPGTGATMERLTFETVQPHQQSEKAQPSQSQPHPQLGDIMTVVPSLALQAVDEKINYLDRLWRTGSDKLRQTVKLTEQSVLTCVLRQVLEEVRIYAVLRETLQSQDFNGQIDTIGTLTEMIRQLEARRIFDITCLQPGVPIPEIPFDQSIHAIDAMAPLLATNNGAGLTTTPVTEVGALPPDNIEGLPMLSSDQPHSADACNPRKQELEQMGSGQTQISSATTNYDVDSRPTEDPEGPNVQSSNNLTVYQPILDTTTTTSMTASSLPTLDRPNTSSITELQVTSTAASSLSSLPLNSRSSSVPSSPTTRTPKWDKLTPNKTVRTMQSDNSRTDLPVSQQSSPAPPALAFSTSTCGNMEQATYTTSGGISNSGRAMIDIEKELRLIREEGQEQRLRTDQLLAQLESEARLRREADHRVSQLSQELQNERYLTLEKDLESKRSEALLMMAKAREEIQQSKVLIAQAKEELALERAAKAEAMLEIARIEVERNRLLAYVQSLGEPPAVMTGGLLVGDKPALPLNSSAAFSARFPSPAGSDGGGGVLAGAPGSGGPPSLVNTETPADQVNRDRPIDDVTIPVKVESFLQHPPS